MKKILLILLCLLCNNTLYSDIINLSGGMQMQGYYDESPMQTVPTTFFRGRMFLDFIGTAGYGFSYVIGIRASHSGLDNIPERYSYWGEPDTLILNKGYINYQNDKLPLVKKINIRVGRQYYYIGKKLVLGNFLPYDAVNINLVFPVITLNCFYARTEQILTSGGYADDLYSNIVAPMVVFNIFSNKIGVYYLLDNPYGVYNDINYYGAFLNGGFYAEFRKAMGHWSQFAQGLRYFFEYALSRPNNSPYASETQQYADSKAYLGGASWKIEEFLIFRYVQPFFTYIRINGDNMNTSQNEGYFSRYSYLLIGKRETTYAVDYQTMPNNKYYIMRMDLSFRQYIRPLIFSFVYIVNQDEKDDKIKDKKDEYDIEIKYEIMPIINLKTAYIYREPNEGKSPDDNNFKNDIRVRVEINLKI